MRGIIGDIAGRSAASAARGDIALAHDLTVSAGAMSSALFAPQAFHPGQPILSDLIKGDDGPNALYGGSNADTIKGLGGDDFLQGNDGDDTVYGGDGNDNMGGGNGFDTMYGGAGDDRIAALGNVVALTMDGPSDVIDGGTGFDTLLVNYQEFVNAADHQPAQLNVDFSTGTGQVLVSGFQGENFSRMESLLIVCPEGDDVITGGKYNDRIDAYDGNDIVKGGAGDDVISDRKGYVNADGGKGWDNMELFHDADTADDIINCNMGTITIGGVDGGTFKNFEWGYMYGGSGNDTIRGFNNGFDSLTGNNGNDTLYAGSQDDRLYGGDGDDRMYGGGGGDLMDGSTGSNTIDGGDGNDDIRSSGTDHVDGDSGNDTLRVNPLNMVAGTRYSGGADTDIMHIAWDSGPGTYDITHAHIDGWESMIGLGYNSAGTFTMVMTVAQLMSFGAIDLAQPTGTSVIQLHDHADVTLAADSAFSELQLANGGQHVDMSAVTSEDLPMVMGGTGADTLIAPNLELLELNASLGDGADHFIGSGSDANVSGGDGDDTLTAGGGFSQLQGNAGMDTIAGGSNNDILNGGGDADHLTGNAGFDTFVYSAASDSTGVTFDTVTGFDFASADTFDVPTAPTHIDTMVVGGNLTTADFDTNMAAAIKGAQLKAGHAVLFQPDSGNYNGDTFLIIDGNAMKGYQAGVDFVILLDGAQNIGSIDPSDFF